MLYESENKVIRWANKTYGKQIVKAIKETIFKE